MVEMGNIVFFFTSFSRICRMSQFMAEHQAWLKPACCLERDLIWLELARAGATESWSFQKALILH